MLITPVGDLAGFLTPEMIIRQRFDGTIIEGSLKSTREAGMHSRGSMNCARISVLPYMPESGGRQAFAVADGSFRKTGRWRSPL